MTLPVMSCLFHCTKEEFESPLGAGESAPPGNFKRIFLRVKVRKKMKAAELRESNTEGD